MAVCALPGSLYTRKIPPEKEVAMLKQACTILLMAATASAQIPVPAFSPRQSGSKSVQRIVIYRRYWHLRRGTSEEVLIVVKPEDSANVALSSLHLEVPSTGDLTVTDIRYPTVHKTPTIAGGPLTMIATPVGDYRIRFKVHAEKNVTGDRAVLNSVLTYKLTDKSGEISNQRADLGIQFALINEHAKTSKTQWPTQGTTKAQEVGIALLLPLFPILFIVSSIVCVATYGADGCRC